MDRRYQELLEQVRLLDTEAFQLKKEELVSQLQEAYAAKDSKRLEQEGKLLEAVQEMQDRTGVTSVDYLKYFYQSLSDARLTPELRATAADLALKLTGLRPLKKLGTQKPISWNSTKPSKPLTN